MPETVTELRYPTAAVHAARAAVEAAETELRDARHVAWRLRDDNQRHTDELAAARSESSQPAGGYLSNAQAHAYGSGSGRRVIYSSHPDDPFRAPYSVEQIADADKAIANAKGRLTKARKVLDKIADETFDVVKACRTEGSRYYRTPYQSTETRYVGQPIPVAEILALTNWELNTQLEAGHIRQLPTL